jgi:predicted RNase H-like HicB family nuclease
MKVKIVVHDAEEGGYWAEVPALPGCITEGDTFEELLHNLYDAVEGWLAVETDAHEPTEPGRTLEIAV